MKNEQRPSSMFFTGEEHDITLPSGKRVTIRESNGEDDGILSKIKNAQDGSNIYNYLANIILKDHDTPDKPLAADIMDWLSNDKYYLLFKQRLINLGPIFTFIHTCENKDCKKKTEYEEDLSILDGDLGKKNYNPTPDQVALYPNGKSKQIEFVSSKKNRFQLDLLTGMLEKKDSDVPGNDRDLNNVLTARNIKIFENSKWVELFDFRRFSSREMAELRSFVAKSDKSFDPVIDITCDKCGTSYKATLFTMPPFFFPGGQT